MSSFISSLTSVLLILATAAVVRSVVTRLKNVSYTVVLVLVGVGVSFLGIDFAVELTHDVILFLILPVVLFFGAMELDTERYRRNLPAPLLLVVVGLPLAVVLIGWLGSHVLGLPLIVSLLFASIIYPIDPAAVIALFHELDAPERILVLTEGESVIDDGFAIVIFSAVLEIYRRAVRTDRPLNAVVDPSRIGEIALNIGVSSVGGLTAGFVVGYFVFGLVSRWVDERMTELLYTGVLAFGAFLVAEHYLGVSGVLATVAVGLLAGATGEKYAFTDESYEFLTQTWDAAEFFVKTLLYLLIGAQIRIEAVIAHALPIVLASGLVLFVRAVVVYSLVAVANRILSDPVPLNYQHIMVWGGMHTVIPIALVLSLEESLPYQDLLRTLVFGVAVLSVLVQGLLMPYVLKVTGVVEGEGESRRQMNRG